MKKDLIVGIIGVGIGLTIGVIVKNLQIKKTRLYYEEYLEGYKTSTDRTIGLMEQEIQRLDERTNYYKEKLDQSVKQTERLLKITGELG